jgi:hypothetical protein
VSLIQLIRSFSSEQVLTCAVDGGVTAISQSLKILPKDPTAWRKKINSKTMPLRLHGGGRTWVELT